MNGLVLHPATESAMEQISRQPGHAVLLVGATGSGKSALARALAAIVLSIEAIKFEDYPYKLVLSADNRAIGIEAVRELEHFLSLRVPRSGDYNRAIIIENAHSLSGEAQTALLKTLEEPPARTLLILTADSEKHVLPTIRSRAPVIHVKSPERASLEQFFLSDFDKTAVDQAYAISGGLPGLM